MKKLTLEEIDELGQRYDRLNGELEEVRRELKAQIDEYGFLPPRAEKSKRLEGELYKVTLSYGTSTSVIDTEADKIQAATSESVFSKLFKVVKKYSVAESAHYLLAGTLPEGAPRNLRQMFEKAVIIAEKAPSLKVELKKKSNEMSEVRERRTPATAGA